MAHPDDNPQSETESFDVDTWISDEAARQQAASAGDDAQASDAVTEQAEGAPAAEAAAEPADAASEAGLEPERESEPEPEPAQQPEEQAPTLQQPAPAPAAPRERRSEWTDWRDELLRVGGRSPLLHFIDTTATRIELSTTHPGGLAQFITGRPTALSSLIRDDLALRAARNAASAISSKGVELASARNIDAVFLGIGIATWPRESGTVVAPVLLRPLVIRRRGRDFELQLRGRPFVNPRLEQVLRDEHGVVLDTRELVALADHEGTFKPNPVLDALRLAAAHVPGFGVQPRLVVSTFADVGESMAADLDQREHTILDAVNGNETARWRLREGRLAVDETPQDKRAPETDRLVLDADSEQDAIIAEIIAGNSVVVEALPGAGGTQTIVNAIGALVGDDKRVLVVSPSRATLSSITGRLADAKLAGLAVGPQTLRHDLIASITRNERAERPDTGEIDDALVRLRKVLLDYRSSLNKIDPDLGVSVLDALRELSRLAMLDEPPMTDARLSRESVVALANDRPRAAATMVKAASLGQFRYGPDDTPWYTANFDSTGDATEAYDEAQRLAAGGLAELVEQGRTVLGATKLRPFESIGELGSQLQLIGDIRETLDKFQPEIFDRPLTELITATGSRREASAALGGMQRRRLRKLAQEYVRPGSHVGDLHSALLRIQTQRSQWRKLTPDGAMPAIPTGLGGLSTRYFDVLASLERLDAALGYTAGESSAELPLDELGDRLERLAAPSDALHNIQERAQLMTGIEALGVDPLVADLATRHVAGEHVENELELAWWQSALESMLASQRALLRGNTAVLSRLEADFALVDEAHVDASSARLAWQLAENWALAIADHPDEADALRQLLKSGSIDAQSLQESAPHLSRPLAPVWLASPYDVHTVPKSIRFDCVILSDAGAITFAEGVGALSRADQVVAIGDTVTQTPAPFDVGISALGIRPSAELASPDELHGESALSRLSQVLPTLRLTRSYRPGGEDLVEAVSKRFYGGAIDALPWAGSYLGHASLTVSTVADSWGLPQQGSAVVESPDAEVERVVALITHHARSRPNESLMVVTGNERHEVRVQQAVVNALGRNPALTDFVTADTDEPFVVADVTHANALSRDRVIFSVGFATSKHSRRIDFGELGEPGGERMLAIAMTRARKAMTIVSSFAASELDPEQCEHGAAALREILLDAERHVPKRESAAGDPLMTDLARRLERRGLRTSVDYNGRLALVVANGGVCAAIESDHDVVSGSLRESLRTRPEILRRLGWHTMRVHAFELFTDPDGVADRIAELVGADAAV